MENKYIISDTLQSLIDWENIMKMERYAGGHDEQMQGLFKGAKVVAHWNEGDYQGMVATCVKLPDGRFAIYNDYYGSCSGCDSWEDATDDEVKAMCINLSNGTFIFQSLNDVIDYLSNVPSYDWEDCAKPLLERINAYCFKLSLYRMGFKDDVENKDSIFKVLLLIDGYLVQIQMGDDPLLVEFSVSQFDGSTRWVGCEHKVQTIELPNHVSDFDVVKYVMSNINVALTKVLNTVSNNIEAKITSNCKDAIQKAMNKDER